ncbi:mechanosensitive ion channel domain-containing protein [Pelagibacterium halotolerans]|uniref:Potassium efflux system KefA protein / small-conductance mechanosensitive channel n=1 Tax=Pelagibacterium halotolerans (strain DSM 22347 / JCM 15775 / CGMCC 1.7692 / B2) TaxID=1082931 RepID=G4RA19_PELHB|nr:mechanosensitive ion channel domain-containing protein [Pelagibacterium halotolerans]AEQ53502.1 potassium efflux system KefA protein / small-conductance mechanosensitive channel [Pelagibacterium halotolerans B2]QJR20320.1 mechanosensitive ion channel [Pelagibacterium halotolerans]
MPVFILSRLFQFFAIIVVCAGLAAPALAQSEGGDGASENPQQALSQLIEVLRDEGARDALIAELEAGLEGSAQETEADTPGDASDELRSIGGQISDVTRSAVESTMASLSQLWRQLAATPEVFSALSLSELNALWAILANVAVLVVLTYGGLVLMRRLVRIPRERLRALFNSGGWIAKPVALVLEFVLDVLAAVIPYAVGYGIAAALLGEAGVIRLEHALYLNAFLMVEIVVAIIRTVVSPNLPEQRLVHLSDGEARSVMGWSRFIVSLFVFGQMMVLPLLTASVSFAAGRAISVVLLLLTLVAMAVAVLVARRPVKHKLMGMIESKEARRGLALPIRNWHIFALLYLAVLAVIALTRTSVQFQAYVWDNVQVVIAIMIGVVILNLIKRSARNGFNLPEGLRKRSPELQRQLHRIVPAVLKVVRFIVIGAIVIFCLHKLGFFNFVDFIEGEFGARVAGSAVTILVILGVAILAWVGLNTWMDSQVNPELAPGATARKRTLFALMRNALTIALIVITLMFVLSEIGINIAPLLASAGVLGLAIGFGAQKLVQDIITGIFIQLEGAIDVGDVVAVGGISGVVERLTIRSVSLRDVEGSYHIIPFSSVDTVTNFMRGFSFAVIDMGVGYRENVEDARQAMLDAFEELRADPEYKNAIIDDFEWMGVNAFGASEVVLRARIKTLPGKQWGVKRAYNGIVKRIFDARDIEIPFPHQTLYFGVGKDGKAPPMHMVREDEPSDGATDEAAAGGAPAKTLEAKPRRRRRKGDVAGKDMPDVDEGPEDET